MYSEKRLSKIFERAEQIPFDDGSRIVLMSDCHRGDGSWADDFSKNQNLFFAALTQYYHKDYLYIELGDGDELWENKKFETIIQTHSNAFWLLSKFYNEGRLYFIYGNHDIVKRDYNFVQRNLSQYFDERDRRYKSLFTDMQIHEGLVLIHRITGDKIFLVHGHQVDFLNDTLWRLARFLVRYLWKPLELFGVNDPTRAAKNYTKKEAVGKKLTQWVKKENQILIAGHTHLPVFPEVGEVPYFNDGSCVHPRCITAIEIVNGSIMLVKWHVKTTKEGIMYIGKDVLAGPRRLKDYFDTTLISETG
ncbi:metallophosphoesterase [Vallitalea okinawensis]|uniref:metallophosphoesterase n=1 Tax=Vallitalea okinawensis TaxID=2078660 RepID=UPI000CFC4CD0|nr:metallophosphoesterase [Vallitalea okinawensis]